MRSARVRFGKGLGGTYHLMSRLVGGTKVFAVENPACVVADYFLTLMRKLEAFHGMRIVTYALLSNHFHILIKEPAKRLTSISDADLVAKIRSLNGPIAAAELKWQLDHLRHELCSPEAAEELKGRYLKRMGNISFFMQDLKGRFSQWYNKRHERYGVLWADRFKSVLVEDGTAMWTMASYIDLNCIRAGLVDDPKDYRYSGYGAASASCKIARSGLEEVFPCGAERPWRELARSYRKLLFTRGEHRKPDPGRAARKGITSERVQAVIDRDGELTLGELVQCRVRYFSDGVALGTARFVEAIFQGNRGMFGAKRKNGARRIAGSELNGLRTLRDLRKSPIQFRT